MPLVYTGRRTGRPLAALALLPALAASLHDSGSAAKAPLEVALDALSVMATGAEYDRAFLGNVKTCWAAFDPRHREKSDQSQLVNPSLSLRYEATQDRIWEGFLNFSATGGTASDSWLPGSTRDKGNGCFIGGRHQPYMEKNYTEMGGVLNISLW